MRAVICGKRPWERGCFRPGSKAFTGENTLLVIFLKV